jgi:hypothetical protein
MRNTYRLALISLSAVTAFVTIGLGVTPVAGQTSRYRPPRTADGKPDFNGIWQANTTAYWDVEPHPARRGPVVALGAAYSAPAGAGVVEGGSIPYQPWALEKKRANQRDALTLDPEIKCYMPGVPRATYMPYPFQILQTGSNILIAYEFAKTARIIHMNSSDKAPADSWMGWSRGRWDGDTLVIDVDSLNDETWFDRSGNFHSDQLQVTERYTRIGPDHLWYEATITDPKVFTRPWKMSMPLYRRLEKPMELLDYNCVEFVEELIYGHLRKGASGR